MIKKSIKRFIIPQIEKFFQKKNNKEKRENMKLNSIFLMDFYF